MPPEIINDIAPIIALVAVGTFVLTGLKMWLTHRAAMRRETGVPEVEQVLEEVAGLRDELRALRGGLVELEERMDFAERLLAQPRKEAPAELPRPGE